MNILPSPCHSESVSGGHGLSVPDSESVPCFEPGQPPIKVRPNQASRCAHERRSKGHGPLAPCEPELLLPLGPDQFGPTLSVGPKNSGSGSVGVTPDLTRRAECQRLLPSALASTRWLPVAASAITVPGSGPRALAALPANFKRGEAADSMTFQEWWFRGGVGPTSNADSFWHERPRCWYAPAPLRHLYTLHIFCRATGLCPWLLP